MSATTYLAKKPTPVLNSPDFSKWCHLDGQGLFRALETILLPGTKLKNLGQTPFPHIIQVATREFPYGGNYYVDERFLVETDEYAPDRPIRLPSKEQILEEMQRWVNTPYVWGGNWPEGIPELLTLYPPAEEMDEHRKTLWQLKGTDCSGLLYKATNGYTPRNTSSLISLGEPLEIEGLTVREICNRLCPLDLIVWEGHVVCVKNSEQTIESTAGKGVVILSANERLEQIIEELKRHPTNCYEKLKDKKTGFTIRRWYT